MDRHSNYISIVANITKNLKEFGYTDLNEVDVLEAYDKAINGKQSEGIIDMMVKNQLEENGLLTEY